MNIKRSYFKLLMASATVGLFLANCTVKNSTDESCEKGDVDNGCECPGNQTGYQKCNSDGVFGECICPDDNSNAGTGNTSTAGKNSSTGGTDGEGGEPTSTGGKTSTAGTNSGGVAPVTGGAGGEGGAGPAFPDYASCEDCLLDLCATEMDACFADESCFSAESDGSGDYEAISLCIERARAEVDEVVKRDMVRACGVTFGSSSDPEPDFSNFSDWAPPQMSIATTNLLNCMATSSSEEPDAKWANDASNFPNNMPKVWPADSCAKLACTSAK